MRRNVLKTLAGFAAAILIILLFTWTVGWREIVSTLVTARTDLLLVGGVLAFSGFVLMGVAWWVMIRDVAVYSMLDGLRVFSIAMFANSITPLGQLGGEPFMAYILSLDSGASMEESFGAVLAADLLNTAQFFTLSFLGVLIYLFYFPLDPFVSKVLSMILVLFAALIAGAVFLWRKQDTGLRWIGHLGAAAGRLLHLLGRDNGIDRETLREKGETFYETLHGLFRRRRAVAKSLLLSHASGFVSVAGIYLIVLSLGIDAPVSALLFVLPAAMVAGYLPLPGGLGGIEVALTLLLNTVAGVPIAIASAGALLFRVFTYWASLLIGGYYSSKFSVRVLSGAPDV